MKLRNKKTGEIGFVYTGINGEVKVCSEYDENHTCLGEYSSLSELNEEWEDYEKPQNNFFKFEPALYDNRYAVLIVDKKSNREEAEKAVERLKAWKRLKDKGFRFDGFDVANRGDNVICGQSYFKAGNYDRKEINSDLDLLFGGEQ